MNLRKTRLSTIATLGIVFILGFAIVVIAVISIAAIRGAGRYSFNETKKVVTQQALNIIIESTDRKAKEYSDYFKKTVNLTEILGRQSKVEFSNIDNFDFPDSDILENLESFEYHPDDLVWLKQDSMKKINTEVGVENIKQYAEYLYLVKQLCPFYKSVLSFSNKYYQVWAFKPEVYLQLNIGNYDNNFPIISKERLIQLIKHGVEIRKQHNSTFFTNPYRDITGPMVISAMYTTQNYTEKDFSIGIDLEFSKLISEVLKPDVPIISNSNEQNTEYVSSFIVDGSNGGTIVAIDPVFYEKIDLPKHALQQDKLLSSLDLSLMDSTNEKVKSFAKILLKRERGHSFIDLNGETYLMAFKKMDIQNWTLCLAVSTKNLFSVLNATETKMREKLSGFILLLVLVSILFILVLNVVVFIFFKSYLVKPILHFRDSVIKLGRGDRSMKLKEHGVFELAILSRSFESLRKSLSKHISTFEKEVTERHRTDNELRAARQVQLSVLPKITSIFENKGIELYAKLLPAKDVAGDYYDFFFIRKNRMVLIIGDVSGKGISASFYMAVTKGTLRNACITEPDDPARALYLANNILCSYNLDKFVTLFLVYYEVETGEIIYGNAGHNEAVVLTSGGAIDVFGCLNNVALGCYPELPYKHAEYYLEKGDTLYLYTDGIVEANRNDDHFYGIERFEKILIQNQALSVGKICRRVIIDVHNFEHGGQFDDITIAALKRE